jgi:hypothetical protein
VSLHEASSSGFRVVDITPASPDVLGRAITGEIPVQSADAVDGPFADSPVVIRKKVFPETRMTTEDAVDHMELVGHDFYLFIDSETDRPSVVYRRKGWDYGVIGLEAEASAPAVAASGRRGNRR